MDAKCSKLEESQSATTRIVLVIFFASLLLIGIGATAVNTLGIPYIDDNVAQKESPLYFGITIGVRIFGPVFGFILGSICTNIHVDFMADKTMTLAPTDPQWIGAWWFGLFIVGIALILTSFAMMIFPRRLPSQAKKYQVNKANHFRDKQLNNVNGQMNYLSAAGRTMPISNDAPGVAGAAIIEEEEILEERKTLKEFPAAVKRLLVNRILLLRTASSVLHILPIAGLYTFLPKYLESQFQLTASKANMISGFAGIMVMGVGIFSSGIFMRKMKPNARFVAAWVALAAFIYSIGMLSLMSLGCPSKNIIGVDGSPSHNFACSETCSCPEGVYSPICTGDGATYLSPCLAGCENVYKNDSQYLFLNCKCIGKKMEHISRKPYNGLCPLECTNLNIYIAFFSFFVLVHSTSEVGSMLLTLRCVDPKDKAMALGLISFAIGLFGNVPCPIIYGYVVDNACIFWESVCGKSGACRIYDPSNFRYFFHGTTAAIMFGAFIVDTIVWCNADRIKFAEEEEVDVVEVVDKGTSRPYESTF